MDTFPWTAEQIADLVRLRAEGLSYIEIAALLGCTKNAAIGKHARVTKTRGESVIRIISAETVAAVDRELLARRPDSEIAREHSVSRCWVGERRKSLGIEPRPMPGPPKRVTKLKKVEEPKPMIIAAPEQIQMPLPKAIEPRAAEAGCQWLPMSRAPWVPCGKPVYRKCMRVSDDVTVLVPTAWCAGHYHMVYPRQVLAEAAD